METTKEIMNDLRNSLVKQYRETLEKLPMKPKTVDCLVDGFNAGVIAGIYHTMKMLDVTIKE